MQFVPLIRWCGGKRKQSEEIVAKFPNEVDRIFIPFLGGGSVMFQVLNSNIKFNKMYVSDLDQGLMNIWDMIVNAPDELLAGYTRLFNMMEANGKSVYDDLVFQFNTDKKYDPMLYFFLTRASSRGDITYDRYGNFTSKCDIREAPILPSLLKPIIKRWSDTIREFDVTFECAAYEDMLKYNITSADYMFMDPPYMDGTWYKDHNMDWQGFFQFIRDLPCDYSMTLNGDRDTYPIPPDLYTKHEYIYYGISTAESGIKSGNRDSLWQRHIMGKYDESIANIRVNQRGSGGAAQTTATDFKLLVDINEKLDRVIALLTNKEDT